MNGTPQPLGERAAAPDRLERLRAERRELAVRLDALLEPPMVVLGLVFLVLVVLDLSGTPMTPEERAWVQRADDAIYWIFVADFLLRLLVTPDKLPWIRANWALALSLVVPFLRPIRSFHALYAVRAVHAGRLVGGLNRGLRSLQAVFRGRSALYLSLLTLLVTLLGAGGTLLLERAAPGSDIATFGDALWWSATLVTTVNSDLDPVTGWGRVVGWLLRVYAVAVFGYLTASIARYLVGEVDRPAPALTASLAPSPVANDPAPADHASSS